MNKELGIIYIVLQFWFNNNKIMKSHKIHTNNPTAKGHAAEVQSVVALIGYNLSIVLAEHHNNVKILSLNIIW